MILNFLQHNKAQVKVRKFENNSNKVQVRVRTIRA